MVLSAKVGLYKSGKRDAAKIMQELPVTPNINKIKKKFFDPPNMPVPYTPEEALALFVDGDYSKHTYKLMQAGAKQRNANTYSTCHIIQLEKEKCYPIYMAFPDVSGEIPLQYLVNKTAERLVYLQSDVLEQKKNHMKFIWHTSGDVMEVVVIPTINRSLIIIMLIIQTNTFLQYALSLYSLKLIMFVMAKSTTIVYAIL